MYNDIRMLRNEQTTKLPDGSTKSMCLIYGIKCDYDTSPDYSQHRTKLKTLKREQLYRKKSLSSKLIVTGNN